jgi:hypothetical protein
MANGKKGANALFAFLFHLKNEQATSPFRITTKRKSAVYMMDLTRGKHGQIVFVTVLYTPAHHQAEKDLT